jgi:hypothetical protein
LNRPATQEHLPDFARPWADQILRRSERLATKLTSVTGRSERRDAEDAALDEFDIAVAAVLAGFRPPQPEDRGIERLVFQPLYDQADAAYRRILDPPRVPGAKPRRAHRPRNRIRSRNRNRRWGRRVPDAVPGPAEQASQCQDLIAALTAAQVEALGPLRLSKNLTARLAAALKRIGALLEWHDMLQFAEVAYDRAGRLYLDMEDYTARDVCLRDLASVRRRALPPGLRRLVQELNAAVVGYGFAPYRLLVWMGAQLLAATSILLVLPKTKGSTKGDLATIYISLQDYINPMGYGDTEDLSHWSWVVLTVESYLGAISLSVFFALLLRKWFRV